MVHLCEVEQDLVMKVNGKGEPLKNPSALVYDILFPKSKGEASAETVYSNYDKFRVLALYILYNNGKPLPRAVLCSPCATVQCSTCVSHPLASPTRCTERGLQKVLRVCQPAKGDEVHGTT